MADPLQATCCTTSRSRVSAAAPIPVPTPVNKTASQKRTASGDWSVEGMMLPAAARKDPGVVNFIGTFPQRLPSSAARLVFPFDIDITPRIMRRVYAITSPWAAGMSLVGWLQFAAAAADTTCSEDWGHGFQLVCRSKLAPPTRLFFAVVASSEIATTARPSGK